MSEYSRKVVENKLAVGPGGNTSMRDGDVMWISPSGFALDDVSDESWVPVNIESGENLHEMLQPSSEVRMHLEIYRQREDVEAIVHTHPPVTIGMISSGLEEVPMMFPDYVAIVGDTVPLIDYVIPCSDELAFAVIGVLKDPSYQALCLRNHGLITVGTNMKQAYYRTEIIEDGARVYWISSAFGQPRVLTYDEKQAILNLEAEKYRQKLLDRS
ncbi:class II aldolase/adducin family protein [Jeotgalibacillus malaysiensis]|uniref:class II aldolase/adducin family protein n=1 Tax=Jeotgalibacillus malaysiensis TaxID=1508404 RepID=UPI00384F61B4